MPGGGRIQPRLLISIDGVVRDGKVRHDTRLYTQLIKERGRVRLGSAAPGCWSSEDRGTASRYPRGLWVYE